MQLNRVKAVEKEKNDLEDVRNEAIEFLTSQNEIVRKQNLLYQKQMCEHIVTIRGQGSLLTVLCVPLVDVVCNFVFLTQIRVRVGDGTNASESGGGARQCE